MKKAEAEKVIRVLCHDWARELGFTPSADKEVSYYDFRDWADAKGYGRYFNFRSSIGPEHDAEEWFIDEMKQRWRY